MGRFATSWSLIKASAAVLRKDRELLVFPIVSMVVSMLALAMMAVPLYLGGFFAAIDQGNKVVQYGVAFLIYLVEYTIIFFCNTALVGAAMIRLRGGDPTVSDGFNIAWQRLGSILGYAFISATVGMVLRALSENAGVVGKFVVSLIGFVWNVATFLVVPVLVVENIGPRQAIARSGQLLRQTWGEQIIGNAGMGLIFGLIFVVVAILGAPLIMMAIASEAIAMVVIAVAGLVLALVAVGLVSSALSGIYTAAVYNYAVSGQTGEFFSADQVHGAFKQK